MKRNLTIMFVLLINLLISKTYTQSLNGHKEAFERFTEELTQLEKNSSPVKLRQQDPQSEKNNLQKFEKKWISLIYKLNDREDKIEVKFNNMNDYYSYRESNHIKTTNTQLIWYKAVFIVWYTSHNQDNQVPADQNLKKIYTEEYHKSQSIK